MLGFICGLVVGALITFCVVSLVVVAHSGDYVKNKKERGNLK